MSKRQLGPNQKRTLEILDACPNSTILEIGQLLYGKPIVPRSKEYSSLCRSIYLLEIRGLVEREGGRIRWHVKDKPQ